MAKTPTNRGNTITIAQKTRELMSGEDQVNAAERAELLTTPNMAFTAYVEYLAESDPETQDKDWVFATTILKLFLDPAYQPAKDTTPYPNLETASIAACKIVTAQPGFDVTCLLECPDDGTDFTFMEMLSTDTVKSMVAQDVLSRAQWAQLFAARAKLPNPSLPLNAIFEITGEELTDRFRLGIVKPTDKQTRSGKPDVPFLKQVPVALQNQDTKPKPKRRTRTRLSTADVARAAAQKRRTK